MIVNTVTYTGFNSFSFINCFGYTLQKTTCRINYLINIILIVTVATATIVKLTVLKFNCIDSIENSNINNLLNSHFND